MWQMRCEGWRGSSGSSVRRAAPFAALLAAAAVGCGSAEEPPISEPIPPLAAEAPALDELDAEIDVLQVDEVVVEQVPAPPTGEKVAPAPPPDEKVAAEVQELPAVAAPPPVVAPPQTRTHTVRRGETLRLIAEQYYGSRSRADEIFQANRGTLSDPNRIRPGQVLTIP